MQVLNTAQDVSKGAHLFPNLRSLEACGDWLDFEWALEALTALFSHSLREINLSFDDSLNGDNFRETIKLLAAKAPDLELLILESGKVMDWVRVGNSALQKLNQTFTSLLSMRNLRILGMPSELLNKFLMLVIAQLPQLCRVNFQKNYVFEKYLSFRPLAKTVGDGERTIPFPILSNLEVDIINHNFEEYLESSSLTNTELRSIVITYYIYASRKLSWQLAQAAPKIEYLSLLSSHMDLSSPEIGSDALTPFTPCRQLKYLEVLGFISNSSEFREVLHLSQWSSLLELALVGIQTDQLMDEIEAEHIELVSMDPNLVGLKIETLSDLASSLPSLKILLITIVGSPVANLANPTQEFRSLESLTLVSSFKNFLSIGFDIEATAQYTAALLRKGTKLKTTEDRLFQHILETDAGQKWYTERYYAMVRQYCSTVHASLSARETRESWT